MTNIARFDPFGDLVLFDPFRDVETMFRFPRSVSRNLPAVPEIRMDVTEDDKGYCVKAEIPGVKKDDIKVSIEGNQVSISAEAKKETETKKGETVVRSERYYGNQYRAFSLPQEIDSGKSEAKYDNGVLELRLPKREGAATKQVVVM